MRAPSPYGLQLSTTQGWTRVRACGRFDDSTAERLTHYLVRGATTADDRAGLLVDLRTTTALGDAPVEALLDAQIMCAGQAIPFEVLVAHPRLAARLAAVGLHPRLAAVPA